MSNCTKCETELNGNYCARCGHPALQRRIDRHYVLDEISSVLNFEKGFLFTVKELIVRPGQNIRIYISEDRNRLVKPIIFIIVTSLIYSIAMQFLQVEDGYFRYADGQASAVAVISQWVQSNYGYANILMGIIIALWLKLFFRKYNYNLFEILILLCFVMGMGMLVFTLFGIAESFSKYKLMRAGALVSLGYCAWAIGQFFDRKKLQNYLISFFAYIMGMITFSLIAIGIGLSIDLIFMQ